MPPEIFGHDKQTVGVILSNTTPPLRVPDYQRDFSWEEEQVSEFWYDLITFDESHPGDAILGKEYFLGAAVFVNNQSWHLILDGQQRLATATILLAALRDKMAAFRDNAANQIQNTFISFEDHITGNRSRKLQLNQFDREFFRDRIQTFPPLNPVAQKRSHKLITKAYDFFMARITERWDQVGGGAAGFGWAGRLSKTITEHMSLVTVTSTDEDRAAEIFETLNDRGIGLSTGDLLRSWLLDKTPATRREEVIGYWSNVFDCAGTGDRAQTLIRWSWVSRQGDVKTRSLHKAIKSTLQPGPGAPAEFSRLLSEDALFYRRVRDGETDDWALREMWLALGPLRAQAGYALLMAANRVLVPEAQKRIATALVSLVFRHNIVCDRERARFETAVFSAAKALSDGDGEQAALQKLRERSPSNGDFEGSFITLGFSKSQASVAQVMLRFLEYASRPTEEVDIAWPPRIHLEHIYPQNPEDDARWTDHDQLVGQIGNLTLLDRRLNEAAQNAAFEIKKRNYYQNSAIRLTQGLLGLDVWDRAALENRQRGLLTVASTIWPQVLVSET